MSARSESEAVLDAVVRSIVFARDRYRCRRCGSSESIDPAHIFSRRTRAIRWDPANIVTLCRACHEWSHSGKGKAAFKAWVERIVDPETIDRLRRASKRPGHPDHEAIGRKLQRIDDGGGE